MDNLNPSRSGGSGNFESVLEQASTQVDDDFLTGGTELTIDNIHNLSTGAPQKLDFGSSIDGSSIPFSGSVGDLSTPGGAVTPIRTAASPAASYSSGNSSSIYATPAGLHSSTGDIEPDSSPMSVPALPRVTSSKTSTGKNLETRSPFKAASTTPSRIPSSVTKSPSGPRVPRVAMLAKTPAPKREEQLATPVRAGVTARATTTPTRTPPGGPRPSTTTTPTRTPSSAGIPRVAMLASSRNAAVHSPSSPVGKVAPSPSSKATPTRGAQPGTSSSRPTWSSPSMNRGGGDGARQGSGKPSWGTPTTRSSPLLKTRSSSTAKAAPQLTSLQAEKKEADPSSPTLESFQSMMSDIQDLKVDLGITPRLEGEESTEAAALKEEGGSRGGTESGVDTSVPSADSLGEPTEMAATEKAVAESADLDPEAVPVIPVDEEEKKEDMATIVEEQEKQSENSVDITEENDEEKEEAAEGVEVTAEQLTPLEIEPTPLPLPEAKEISNIEEPIIAKQCCACTII